MFLWIPVDVSKVTLHNYSAAICYEYWKKIIKIHNSSQLMIIYYSYIAYIVGL